MSAEEFDAWAKYHCELTAASAEVGVSLVASSAVFTETWGATYAELCECTVRLLRGLRVPKFANEHAEAVARELMALRSEAVAESRPDHSAAYYESPKCLLCGGSGFVPVPHWLCVAQPVNDKPRLVPYPGTKRLVTGVVLCDRPGCERGDRVRALESKRDNPRPTFGRYLRLFGGLDVREMLRAHERSVAEHCRRRGGDGDAGFGAVVARIKQRVEQGRDAA